jgi:hypothetical protein
MLSPIARYARGYGSGRQLVEHEHVAKRIGAVRTGERRQEAVNSESLRDLCVLCGKKET